MINNGFLYEVKSIDQLPEWFNLENYAPASDLNAKGWYEQLFIRWFCYTTGMLENLSSSVIDKIRQKSIIEIAGNEQFETIMQFSTTKLHSKAPLDIHFTTLRELALLSTKLPSQFEYAVKWITQNHLNPQFPHEEFIDEPITDICKDTEGDNLIVTFNKNLPETALMKQFQNFIQNIKRQSEKGAQKFNHQKWHKYGILPYIDLQMWSIQHENHITIEVLANAIHPYGERNEDNLRKTTIPNANFLMTPQGLLKLASQIE